MATQSGLRPGQIPNIRKQDGSFNTTDILLGLAAAQHRVKRPKTPDENPALVAAIIYDQPLASTHLALRTSQNRLLPTASAVSESISRLEGNKETKEMAPQFGDQLTLLRRRTNELNQTEHALQTNFQELKDKGTEEIRELLQKQEKEGEKLDPNVIKNKWQPAQVQYVGAVKDYMGQQRKTQYELDKLHNEVYVRTKDKSKLTSPEEIRKSPQEPTMRTQPTRTAAPTAEETAKPTPTTTPTPGSGS